MILEYFLHKLYFSSLYCLDSDYDYYTDFFETVGVDNCNYFEVFFEQLEGVEPKSSNLYFVPLEEVEKKEQDFWKSDLHFEKVFMF